MPFTELGGDVPLDAPGGGPSTAAGGGFRELDPGEPLDQPDEPGLLIKRIGHAAAAAGAGLVRGAVGDAGLPGDFSNLFFGTRPDWLPTSREMVDKLENLPVVGQALQSARPQNTVERLLAGTAEGVGSQLPLAFFPGLGGVKALGSLGTAVPTAIRAAEIGGGAGLGSSAVQQFGPSLPAPFDTAAQLAGGLAGALAGARGAPLSRLAGTAIPLARFAENTAGQLDTAAAAARNEAAPAGPLSLQQLGNAAKRSYDLGVDRLKQDTGALWQPLDAQAATLRVDANPAFQGLLEATIGDKAGVLSEAQINRLQRLGNNLGGKMAADGTVSWDDMRDLRTKVGEQLHTAATDPSMAESVWRGVYGDLAQSLGDSARGNGLGPAFDTANRATVAQHDYLSQVGRLVGREGLAPETIAGNLLKAPGSTLAMVRANMPGAADNLLAAKIRSPDFLAQYQKLEPEAVAALAPPGTPASAAVGNLVSGLRRQAAAAPPAGGHDSGLFGRFVGGEALGRVLAGISGVPGVEHAAEAAAVFGPRLLRAARSGFTPPDYLRPGGAPLPGGGPGSLVTPDNSGLDPVRAALARALIGQSGGL